MNMTKILASAIRVFSVFLCVNALILIPSILAFYTSERVSENVVPIASAVLKVGLPLFMALVLWLFPITIAKWILPFSEDDQVKCNGKGLDLYFAGLSFLGVYFICFGFIDVVYYMTPYILAEPMVIPTTMEYKNDFIAGLASSSIEVIIGLALVLRYKVNNALYVDN